jgi:hypothetical protein
MINPFDHIQVDFCGEGAQYTATANSTTDHDLLVSAEKLLNGGTVYFDKAIVGDKFTCQVLDNSLVVKKEWVTDWPVIPGYPTEFLVKQAAIIPANYHLRIKYTSTSLTDDVTILVGYGLYKEII